MSTGNPYRGINSLLLQVAAMKGGFRSQWWGHGFHPTILGSASLGRARLLPSRDCERPLARGSAGGPGSTPKLSVDKALVITGVVFVVSPEISARKAGLPPPHLALTGKPFRQRRTGRVQSDRTGVTPRDRP